MEFLARVFFHTSLCRAFFLSFSSFSLSGLVPRFLSGPVRSVRYAATEFSVPIEFSTDQCPTNSSVEKNVEGKLIRVFVSSRIGSKDLWSLFFCFLFSIILSIFPFSTIFRPHRHFYIWLNYFASSGAHCSPLLNFDWDLLNNFIVFLHIIPILSFSLFLLLFLIYF